MRTGAILSALNTAQQVQRGALMPWSPVVLAFGIALYFAIPTEPGATGYALAALAVVAGLGLGLWQREALAPLGLALALIGAGVGIAGFRAHQVAGPVLDFHYYGPIEGRIVGIDRSASDALRITLDQVRLDDVSPARTPRRVRISLHGDQRWLNPDPGARLMTTGHLSAPAGPAEPGGFDFQRHAWFLSLGAVGYTRTPALLAAPREGRAAPIFHLRMNMSRAISAAIPGQPGAFAAAVLTGDRSGLEQGPVENMRVANIAHLLAISGLHMGLLTGFVYGALRLTLALIPPLALRYPIRKWAAVSALAAGAFYLALSGGNVATERAFIQVAVMLTAVLFDRRAITLRSVALAALIVLLHRPETLFSPGFQMSFAATTALVAAFTGLRGVELLRARPAWQRWLFALVLSSLVAGLATAPFAAAHFNRLATYGLIANLLTVPVMGSVVIPLAVMAALLWPFGLSGLAFATMEPGLVWILGVAARVAEMPGAARHVVSPPPGTLGLIAMGALLVILWRGKFRWTGVLPLVIAMALWGSADRPNVLISDTGRLVGVMTDQGRSLSRPRGDGFVAGVWLENDGDSAAQDMAADRPAWVADGWGRRITLAGQSLWHGAGRRALEDVAEACMRHDIVVLSEPAGSADPPVDPAALAGILEWPNGRPPGVGQSQRALGLAPAMALLANADPTTPTAPTFASDAECWVIDSTFLDRHGALALTFDGPRPILQTAAERQGDRLWTR